MCLHACQLHLNRNKTWWASLSNTSWLSFTSTPNCRQYSGPQTALSWWLSTQSWKKFSNGVNGVYVTTTSIGIRADLLRCQKKGCPDSTKSLVFPCLSTAGRCALCLGIQHCVLVPCTPWSSWGWDCVCVSLATIKDCCPLSPSVCVSSLRHHIKYIKRIIVFYRRTVLIHETQSFAHPVALQPYPAIAAISPVLENAWGHTVPDL